MSHWLTHQGQDRLISLDPSASRPKTYQPPHLSSILYFDDCQNDNHLFQPEAYTIEYALWTITSEVGHHNDPTLLVESTDEDRTDVIVNLGGGRDVMSRMIC